MSEIDPFQSSTLSSILSWMFSVPILLGLVFCGITLAVSKPAEISRVFTVWIVICIIFLTPIRYVAWQFIVMTCYPFQSFRALMSCITLSLYVPIVFGILYFIALVLPIVGTIWLVGAKEELSAGRQIAAGIVMPFACLACSFLFYLVLPLAAWTVSWLDPYDVIAATNGPSHFFYEYVVSIGTPLSLPRYFNETDQTITDLIRCHTATMYLSDYGEIKFVAKQYPDLYELIALEPVIKPTI